MGVLCHRYTYMYILYSHSYIYTSLPIKMNNIAMNENNCNSNRTYMNAYVDDHVLLNFTLLAAP